MKNRILRKSFAVSLVMALLLSMLVLQGSLASEYLVAKETVLTPFTGSISLDVNPSIELIIEDGAVKQALTYNDDGKALLTDNSITGLTAEEAVKALTKALVEGGYLASADVAPYLVITVSGNGTQEDDAAEALQKAARQVAEELGTEFEIKSAFVSDDVAAQAAAIGLSTGKYMLMQYIAKTEGISLEEAIAKYGATKIGELMDQFEDAEDLFDGDRPELTEEQRVVLNAAFDQQKESIKAAESTFHDAFKALKATYRNKVHNAIKAQKDGDAQALIDALLNQLKEQMMAEYQTMRQTLDDTISAARATFMDAVTAAGIPEEVAGQYFAWHMNKEMNSEGELNAFLKEFIYKAEEMEEQDEGKDVERDKDKDKEQDEDKDEGRDEYKHEDRNEDKDEDRDENKDEDQGSKQSNNDSTQSAGASRGESDDKGNNDNSGKGKK